MDPNQLDQNASLYPADFVMDETENLLVIGEYSKAVELCRIRLDDLKNMKLKDDTKDEISGFDAESLCIIAMQALAEQDQWNQLLPFLEHAYNNVQALTPKLVQLCICFYGKARDFSTAENIVYKWLDNSTNNTDRVTELFILHILVPQQKYQEALALINSSSAFSLEKRSEGIVFINSLMEKNQLLEHHTSSEQEESEKIESPEDISRLDKSPGENNAPAKELKTSNDHSPLSYLFSSIVRKFSLLVSKYIPILGAINWQSLYSILKKLALIGIFIFLIIRANLDVTSSHQHILKLGHGIVKIWRAMFSPYHVAALQ